VNGRRRAKLNAITLDELLAGLDAETLAAIQVVSPAGLLDQVSAAAADTIHLMEKSLDKPGGAMPIAPHQLDAWIRLGILDTFAQWFNGTGRTCLHSSNPRRPQSVWSAAWRPNLVVCTHCVGLLRLRGDAGYTCDACGRVCAGPEHGDPIHTVAVVLGALSYQAGCCRDCLPEAVAA
jgi:hypothetical protein